MHWRACLRRLFSGRAGSINIIAAISAPVVLMMGAFGIDHGNLVLTKQTLQQHADLAAIVGASDIANAEAVVLGHFQRNGVTFVVRDGTKMLTKDGNVVFSEKAAFDKYGGYAELIKGHYTADPTLAPDKRFVAGAIPVDALKVTIRHAPKLFFPNILSAEPRLHATGVASAGKVATVAISSRLSSLDAGIVNKILGTLTGTTLSLSLMDTQALVETDVSVLAFADQLATDLNIQAANYEKLLAAEVTFVQATAALSKSGKYNAATTTALNRLIQQTSKSKAKFTLGKLLSLGPYSKRRIGSLAGFELKAGLMEVISTAANIANAGHQVSLDLDGLVPGLTTAKLTMMIGEPEIEAPYYAVARPGSAVRTAQTRLKLVTEINGLSAIVGLKIKLPLYIDLAKAEGKISAVGCSSGLSAATASADVEVKPAVADIALGNVNDSDFFSSKSMSVSNVALVDSPLLKVNTKSRVTATNAQATTLKFSANEIKAGTTKSVSTKDLLASMTSSLLSNLTLDIQVLNITLGNQTTVTKAIGKTLDGAVKPVDDVLFNVLALSGIRIGEADVRVGAASCQRPVVVN